MKIIAISAILLLVACSQGGNAEPVPQEVCSGKLERVTGKHLRMTCDNGQVINYTSYKYDMTVK